MPDFRQAVKLNGIAPVGLVCAVAAKTGNYTLTAADSIILAGASGGAFTITLPTAAGITGRTYTVKKTDTSTNAVTIATTSSQTIDGLAAAYLVAAQSFIQVTSDGSNWQVTGGNHKNTIIATVASAFQVVATTDTGFGLTVPCAPIAYNVRALICYIADQSAGVANTWMHYPASTTGKVGFRYATSGATSPVNWIDATIKPGGAGPVMVSAQLYWHEFEGTITFGGATGASIQGYVGTSGDTFHVQVGSFIALTPL